ncbi:GNAT family N-acetyltransferase [Streptomyces sp. TRM66268-LWL]|uniref:GNAT family N-acetyltransferase n=1 Tax=Streptomyces polyasparticus TaxID=2767826 RepID=A0ABR7SSC3_9ACTN|nr:bifunctional GNAT family N-acetyltransferase/acetate--CoA ligase family protein [Streptomyces polyasparticus]MBC9718396.1 GNAT family N-acetyltransferase [Streptomyces polyasparticus]
MQHKPAAQDEQGEQHAYPAHWEADIVLRDGGTARIRPITTEDAERLVSFYEQVSDESKYYRFFAPYPRLSDKDVHRFTHHDYVDRVGLAVTIGGEFIATVRYDRIDENGRPASGDADEAEVAFLVQDAHQGRGVASALLEHIAAVARERGIRRFAAEVLPNNNKMIKVFRDAGYTQKRSFEDGVVRLEFDLEPTEASLAVQRAREQRAEARSVQRLLAPASVAVIGVGRQPGGVGRTVLQGLVRGAFTGQVYAVNPAASGPLEGVPAVPSVRDIAEPVDLAVIAVPVAQVPAVVAECGEKGVRGLVVLSAGYAESGPEGRERQRELVRQARSYGMRLIGPNAFGVLNTAPDLRLNASLAPELPAAGRIGLFTQSGGIGIALLAGLHRRGAGLSSFVSAGNRSDVSGNDLLQYWYDDPRTDVVLMYLESIGNPRKFTRLARRTALAKPLVVVQGARHGGVAPAGHAVPGTRLPHATVAALLRQAGVIRVDTVTELIDVGVLLAGQPLPAGPRVGILGNSESLGLLTYDACLAQGLRPQRPLDLTTSAAPADFRAALSRALADDGCDAVVITAIPWVREGGDGAADREALAAAVRETTAAGPAKPVVVVAVELGGLAEALSAATRTAPGRIGVAPVPDAAVSDSEQAASEPAAPLEQDQARSQDSDARPVALAIPTYPAAERAARALGEAWAYAQWRREAAEPGKVPELERIDEQAADERIEAAGRERGDTAGFDLGPVEARALLADYGIEVTGSEPAWDESATVEAAALMGYPVALKATAPHLRHRPDLGSVRLDLANEEQLRSAHAELTGLFGKGEEARLVVQPMVPRGVDTVVRASVDPGVGAVLSFGLAGAPSQLLGDTAHRLIPVTDRDAAALIRSIRTAPLLFGWRGSDPVDTAALEELLQRLSRLLDDHPQVVSVDLEPVIVAHRGAHVLSARVRLAPPPARDDLGPRTLPAY